MALFTQLERAFIFFPTREVLFTPDMVGLGYEEVFFTADDGTRLHGWYVPGRDGTDITWLWFHGNGGDIGHRVEEIAQIHQRLGVNLFIFDYRGYGNSEGSPSEQGTYQDARAALEYLHSREDAGQTKVVYFGRSLGAAVAVELATQHPPGGMVLVAPFASLSDMARTAYPQIPFAAWIMRNRFDSLSRIGQVNAPLLVIHGEMDDIVPVSQGRKLYGAANQPKQFLSLPSAGHNDTNLAGGETYWEALGEFMETVSKFD